MYSKDVTIWRNIALKRQDQLLNNAGNDLKTKLMCLASLKSRQKGSRDR